MSLLLKGATLIDGTGAEPRTNTAILIEGNKIRSIGDAAEIVAPPGASVIDVAGKVIMPGLIDCHDHLSATGFDLMERASAPLSLTMMRIADNLRVTLEAGITTLRDLGGLDIGFQMAVEQGLIPGPRLLVALTILSRTGGIDDPRLRSGVDLSWRNLPGLPSAVCDGVEECRKRVREILHAGADVIKCASTGGVSSQTLTAMVPTLTLEELQVIVNEAHMFGKRTSVHAYGGPGLENAVLAGIDSVEHGAYLCRLPETIKRMAAQNTYFVPTFMVLALHREKGSPFARKKATELVDEHRRSLEMAMEAGIPVAMGTDAGAYGHGHNAIELQLMTEAGMTPMQAIVASTKTAAACLGLESELGTLEPGKLADLLVVDGDPFRDIGILDRKEQIVLVMKNGTVCVDRLRHAPES
jgi:imidazolonepropionase-like amidohydrolase